MKLSKKRNLAFLLALMMLFSSIAVNAETTPQEEEELKATLLLCSDFQTELEVDPYENLSAVPTTLTSPLTNLSKVIYDAGHTQIDSVLVAGDYSAFTAQYNYDADPTIPIIVMKDIIRNQWSDLDDFLFVQGNHDHVDYPYAEGANEYDEYIVYCINGNHNDDIMGGFPWYQGATSGTEDTVKLLAARLETYFGELIEKGETRPVFVMAHVPLHFTGRTSSLYSHRAGDNMYASHLFEVLNSAAEDLDIVYTFGHNHSRGWDNYVGGSRVFKQAGDTILLPDSSKKDGSTTDYYLEETLNFTYLNAGYLGYVTGSTAANELTATVCTIYDDKLVFERYSQDGTIALGSNGAYNIMHDDSVMIDPDHLETETPSPSEVAVDRIKESGVKLEDKECVAGRLTEMHAVPKNIDVASYSWDVSDPSVAMILDDGKDINIFAQKEGTTEMTVSVTDTEGNIYQAEATLEVIPRQNKTVVRTNKLVDGEQYMLVGSSQDYSSVRLAVTGSTKLGNKGDGTQVFRGTTVSGLNLQDTANEVEATDALLWTAVYGENGKVALYNKAADKYMYFQQGSKSVALVDTPTYFDIMWSTYASKYKNVGDAIAFHTGTWYLNYSDSQSGFPCTNAASYNQDGTHITNQYALYGVKSEKSTLNTVVAWADNLKEKCYTPESWNGLEEALAEANTIQANDNAVQKEVDDATGTLLSALKSLEAQSVLDAFDDVADDWYTEPVQFAYENNLMTGIEGTNNFEPNGKLTKAQVAQILFNMEGAPLVTDLKVFTELKDVSITEWYAAAVAWAYSTNIVTGDLYSQEFRPNEEVTREQLALMMYRYAAHKNYRLTTSGKLDGFKDAADTSDWAVKGMKWAVGKGLISGVAAEDGTMELAPQGTATRAQMAAILQRFHDEFQ